MRFGRIRLWIAGMVAFLLGFPLSDKVLASGWDIFESSVGLGFAIADSAGDS
jgi:hypothetical protein